MICLSDRKILLLTVEILKYKHIPSTSQKPRPQLEVEKFELQNLQPIFDC